MKAEITKETLLQCGFELMYESDLQQRYMHSNHHYIEYLILPQESLKIKALTFYGKPLLARNMDELKTAFKVLTGEELDTTKLL